MERNTYDLSHLCHLTGQIGRLQTMTVIPVVAGDSLQLSLDGIVRLSPTRKEIVSECQIDICGFYVPHRHVYGQDWIDFLQGGPNESQTFTGVPVPAADRFPVYLTLNACGTELPKHLVNGYNMIYQRYFAVPSTDTNGQDGQGTFSNYDYIPTTADGDAGLHYLNYGKLAARLPHILNGGNLINTPGASGFTNELDSDDWEVPSATMLDIRELGQIQARYKTQTQTAWFANFYKDVLNQKWQQTVNIDADQRPEYLFRETIMLSGQDVNGADDATLGSFVGKTLDRINASMPRKVFFEHGNVWIVMLLRYPLVHNREQHPLLTKVNFNNLEMLGDHMLWAAEPPVPWNPGNWLSVGSGYTPGPNVIEPYGQHYRYQPNRVCLDYQAIPGYPFLSGAPASLYDYFYHVDNEYAPTFQTQQIGQWQSHLRVTATKFSVIPDASSSIFAGT